MVASAARSGAVLVVLAWLAYANPERGLAYAWVLGTASVFLVTGLAQLWLYARAIAPPAAPYASVFVDSLLLASVLLAPNPFATTAVPPAMPLRFAGFLYFFVLLMQMAFSFRPRLLVWSTLCGIGAWTLGFLTILYGADIVTDPPGADMRMRLATYFAPNYVSHLKFQTEVIVFLVVGAGLALLVRRSRALVTERAEAERERGNLARYFSPKVVDVLAERDEPLGRVRRQPVGVLFADLVGFTTLAEEMTPEDVMAMLRAFHGRMEEEIFRHGGCLEKFIGDALLATFGVPWNDERAKDGLPPMRMGLGVHYGQVVAGDIGSRRSMAFATVGDTTNVTSRLQALTRDLDATIVASGALVEAVEREDADVALLQGLKPRGPHTLRGRDAPIELWTS